MNSKELADYLKLLLAEGKSEEEIKEELLAKGFNNVDVDIHREVQSRILASKKDLDSLAKLPEGSTVSVQITATSGHQLTPSDALANSLDENSPIDSHMPTSDLDTSNETHMTGPDTITSAVPTSASPVPTLSRASSAGSVLETPASKTSPESAAPVLPARAESLFDIKHSKWYEWAIGLPMFVLIAFGGLLGALIGVIGWGLCVKVMRIDLLPSYVKVFFILVIILICFIVNLFAESIVFDLLNGSSN